MIRVQKIGAALFALGAVAAVTASIALARGGSPRVTHPPAIKGLHTASSSNTLALGEVRGKLYAFVADEDRRSVRVFDPSKNEELDEIALGAAPGHVIVEGGSVFVSVPSRNEVREVRFADRTIKRVYSTCDEPIALEVDGPRDRLLVLCAWGHALQAFNHTTGALELDVDLPREPRAMVRAEDSLGIAHAVGSKVSFVSLANGTSRSVDLSGKRRPILDDGSGGLALGFFQSRCPSTPQQHALNQGYAVAAVRGEDSETRWVIPMVDVVPMPAETTEEPRRPRPAVQFLAPSLRSVAEGCSADPSRCARRPGLEFSGYGVPIDMSCVAIPPTNGRVVVLDADGIADPQLQRASECRLPRAIAKDPLTGAIAVACLGDDLVQVRGGTPRLLHVPAGPTGIAYDDRGRLFTWSAFDHTLSITEPDGLPYEVAARSRRPQPPSPFELGRAIFHATDNRSVSSDGRACASCHPSGREDGLVWGAPDGPRQTPMLVGRLQGTAPYGWNGTRDTIAGHMGQTMKRLGGTGLDPHEIDAVITYVTTLEPPRSRARVEVAAPVVERGRDLFEAKGCSGCHVPESAFTDGYAHDFDAARPVKRSKHPVKAAPSREKIATFDTPSLRLVGGTAPYFHDGRYASLHDLLSDKKSTMADLSSLDATDVHALEEYLRTL